MTKQGILSEVVKIADEAKLTGVQRFEYIAKVKNKYLFSTL